MINVIINGPPRSGNHYLLGLLKLHGHHVMVTHDPNYIPGYGRSSDYQNHILLINTRRDVFASVMSNLISIHTGQTTDYPEHEIDRFSATQAEFEYHYNMFVNHRKKININKPWRSVHETCFEDFMSSPGTVLTQLDSYLPIGHTSIEQISQSKKLMHTVAPYNFKQIIINHEEMLEFYWTLQKTK